MVDGTRTSVTSGEKAKRHSFIVNVLIRLVKEKPLGTIGLIIVLLMLFVGIFADFLAPYPRDEVHALDSLSPPSAAYILGTDLLGRDLLTRIIHGARVSVIVGLTGSGLATVVALIIGLPSGFFGGKYDMTVQRFVDAFLCFPSLFIYLTVMAIVGQGMVQVIVVLGILYGIRQTRVIRSAVIGIRENMYINAAIAIGCPPQRIIFKHILPNIVAPVIIIFSLNVGYMIMSEATLSFLGFGIPPPVPSWGGMISGQGRSYMLRAPWIAIWPGLALTITVYGINVLGDAVRDIQDPKLRGGVGRYGATKPRKNKKGGDT